MYAHRYFMREGLIYYDEDEYADGTHIKLYGGRRRITRMMNYLQKNIFREPKQN